MIVDMIICTRDPGSIRADLLESLHAAPWVRSVIIETSKPLSIARKRAAEKATGEWMGYVDDDVEIPQDWFERVSAEVADGVVAVSSQFTDHDPHIQAFQKAYQLYKRGKVPQQTNICNCLIRRDVLLSFDPPPTFLHEDDILYKHATKQGKWITIGDIGVKHWYRWKHYAEGGRIMRSQKIFTLKELAKILGGYFVFSVVAMIYSRSLKTPRLFWKRNFETIWGYLVG